jgi:hypothetical protein
MGKAERVERRANEPSWVAVSADAVRDNVGEELSFVPG